MNALTYSIKQNLIRCGLAIAAVIAAFLLRLALEWYVGESLPLFITFYPLVMIVALLAGFWAGFIATITAALISVYWIIPPIGFSMASFRGAFSLAIFSIMGLAMSLLAEFYRRGQERLISSQKKLIAMNSEIILADERSRQRFASDLHDTVVQTMGAAKLRSQFIQDRIPPDAQQIFTEMQDMISQSITQARSIMTEMSPRVLHELGLIPALEWLTEQTQKQHGISINFISPKNGPQPVVHEIQVLLFQATRELLMNIVKHAKAESAVVKISGKSDRVKIEVTDDGTGFDKKTGISYRPEQRRFWPLQCQGEITAYRWAA